MALARWQATIVDGTGDVLPFASVEVRSDIPGQPLIALFSDRDGLVPIGNPFLADAEGFAAFHVAGGFYKITATLGGFTRVWRYVALGTAAALDGEAIVGVAGASGSFVGDGVTVAFDIALLIGSAASLLWFEDGIFQRSGIDYTVSGSVVTRTTAPADGAIISWVLLGSAGDVSELSLKVDKAGDIMSGALTLFDDGVNALHAVPKQQLDAAIATEVTNRNAAITAAVVGLFDDRGNYDASVNTFPASGGSGTAGAILKGDIWTASVAGTLGGVAVGIGDTIRAIADTPGQTAANWAVGETNIGFVPENVANKDTDTALTANSDTKYASQKAAKAYSDTKIPSSYLDTDGTLAANSDAKVATQKAVKTFVAASVAVGAPAPSPMLNGTLVEGRAANAATYSLKDGAGSDPSGGSLATIRFPSLAGGYADRTVGAALAVTIPSGTTIGHVSLLNCPIYIYAIDNAGTVELALSCKYFGRYGVVTTVAIAGGASPVTMYSASARTSKNYVLIGVAYSAQTTAGTWAAAPTSIMLAPFDLKGYLFAAYLAGDSATWTNAGFILCPLGTAVFDADVVFDTTNSRFVCREPGVYGFKGSVTMSETMTGICIPTINLNGGQALVGVQVQVTSQGPASSVDGNINMAPGDYVDLRGYQTSGVTKSFYGSGPHTRLAGNIIR